MKRAVFIIFIIVSIAPITQAKDYPFKLIGMLRDGKCPKETIINQDVREPYLLLKEIAADRTVKSRLRVQAIVCLASQPDKGIIRLLRNLCFDRKEKLIIKATAIEALGYAGAAIAIDILSEFLESKNKRLKAAAVVGLAYLATDRACELLKETLGREKDLNLKIIIDKYYQRCKKKRRQHEVRRDLYGYPNPFSGLKGGFRGLKEDSEDAGKGQGVRINSGRDNRGGTNIK